jgi:hypothetical protein
MLGVIFYGLVLFKKRWRGCELVIGLILIGVDVIMILSLLFWVVLFVFFEGFDE